MPTGIHPDDDTAHNIIAQQQRDAAPSPDAVRAEVRAKLERAGCEVCDEDDPDRLNKIWYNSTFRCQKMQQPNRPFTEVILCDEHERPSDVLSRAHLIQKARKSFADLVVEYECGNVVFLDVYTSEDALVSPIHTYRGCNSLLSNVTKIDTGDPDV